MQRVTLFLLVILLGACTAGPRPGGLGGAERERIETALRAHVEELASDAYEGRKPGTEGEAKTLRYLAAQWQLAGLESGTNDPANPWFAPVELSLSTPAESDARFYAKGQRKPIDGVDAWLFTAARKALVDRAPMLFVGRRETDLDRAEVAGRVVLMMWDHARRREQRDALLDMDAAAVIAVVEDPVEMAELIARRKQGSYRLADENSAAVIEGFISLENAARLAGEDRLEEWTASSDPAPHRLPVEASLEATSTPGTVKTHNLIARLPGKDPAAGAVLLLSHWDHFGICGEEGAADRICNGAIDNASGLAVLTETARALAAGPKLDRDVYFLATTAEEWGLLGARAFAQEPPIPLDTIVAAFNIDMMGIAEAGSPVVVIGRGMTGLDDAVDGVIAAAGRKPGDEEFAAGFVRRQDGWALLQRDVPTLSVSGTFADRAVLDPFLRGHYHRPGDEPDVVELGGAVDDLALHLALVRHFASTAAWPGAGADPVDTSGENSVQ